MSKWRMKVLLLTATLAACSSIFGPELPKPIMHDHPLFDVVCVDSVMPAPEGMSCYLDNVVVMPLIIQNPNPRR